MKTCKDCIHCELCYKRKTSVSTDPMKNGYKCPDFIDKYRCLELPFIAMIEQTVVNGKPKFTKSAASKNGMYCVVYSDPKKWRSPLIDICGETYYRADEAEARLEEILKEVYNYG